MQKRTSPSQRSFFKEIMNPESTPERMNDFLSLLLGTQVRIHTVLPNDSTRIADESSLLITDLIVELEDGSLANVEVQKIGYKFPGQRSACYSADMLLRQYKRVRSELKKKFSYREVKSVYTIVLFETSTKEFHEFPDTHIHRFEQQSDSGLKLELLQKYVFIPIDIFIKNQQNKNITSKLDAWLLFFSTDKPKDIVKLIEAYPEFKPMYKQVYAMYRNMEVVMGFFSEELRELDRNTVQLMIDEMQEELEKKRNELGQVSEELGKKIEKKSKELEQKNEELEQKNGELEQKGKELEQKNGEIERKNEELEQKNGEIERKNEEIEQKNEELEIKNKQLEEALSRYSDLPRR